MDPTPQIRFSCTRIFYFSLACGDRYLVVGVGLGQVLLQERQVLVGRLSRGLGAGGSSLGRGWGGERRLLGVELGQLRGEVGREGRGLGGLGRVVASDAGRCVGSLWRGECEPWVSL